MSVVIVCVPLYLISYLLIMYILDNDKGKGRRKEGRKGGREIRRRKEKGVEKETLLRQYAVESQNKSNEIIINLNVPITLPTC